MDQRSGTSWDWLTRGRSLPTTAAGAEQAVVILVVGTRLGAILQMAPSLTSGIERSPRPASYLTWWIVAALAAVLVSLRVIKQGHGLSVRDTVFDVALAIGLLVSGAWDVLPDDRFGTWIGYQPGYALTVMLAACVARDIWFWLGTVAVLTAGQTFYALANNGGVELAAIVGHNLSYIVLAVVTRAALMYLRRVASDADAARSRAAELARREEERRAQVAIHNGAAVMRLLADPGLDTGSRLRLQEQARLEAARMRSYLTGGDTYESHSVAASGAGLNEPVRLAPMVSATCRRFDDMHIEPSLDLAEHVDVPRDHALAVQNALTSLLLNVRSHADAGLVVVHLDAPDGPAEPATWTLTVHDDGHGFDSTATQFGVGLREVVIGELARRGIDATISSQPGRGTTATVTGPQFGWHNAVAEGPATPDGAGMPGTDSTDRKQAWRPST